MSNPEYNYRVTGARGAVYECTTMREAKKLAGAHGRIQTQNKSRYDEEAGDAEYLANSLRQYVVPDDVLPTHAFSMTKVDKLGINTKTEYMTPAGVFMYPLTESYLDALLRNMLPYVSNSPYVQLAELRGDSDQWLIFAQGKDTKKGPRGANNLTEDRVQKLEESLLDMVFNAKAERHSDLSNLREALMEAEPLRDMVKRKVPFRLPEFNTDSLVWEMSRRVAIALVGKGNTRRNAVAIAWNSVLRKLGFVGAVDFGYGIIHPSEPQQLVAFSPKAYKLIDSFNTESLRRSGRKGEISRRATLQMARSPSTSIQKLTELASSTDPNIKRLVAGNPNTPTAVLDAIVADSILSNKSHFNANKEALQEVADNPNASRKALNLLSTEPDILTRIGVVQHENTSSITLTRLLRAEEDLEVVNALLDRPDMDRLKVRKALAKSKFASDSARLTKGWLKRRIQDRRLSRIADREIEEQEERERDKA